MPLSIEELKRYSRHLNLPEFGSEGQEALRDASVLLVGAGGLGSPVALYLAAAGVGRLTLVDMDTVALSNLQRQVLYTEGDIGSLKVDSARRRLAGLNPQVRIDCIPEALHGGNARELVREHDLVIDGTDNFPTRYLVNDACVLENRPNCYGSVYRFDGQASVFHYRGGPCYRCVFPAPPPPEQAPSCAEGGVLGILPGLVGVIQASEAIKILAGIGSTLSGRLQLIDVLSMSFQELTIRRRPDCPVCGDSPTIRELVDYQQFCNPDVSQEDLLEQEVPEIGVEACARRMTGAEAPFLLDIREAWEREICLIEGATWIPQHEVKARLKELPRDRDIVLQCRSGVRSHRLCVELRRMGFERCYNLVGGILEWGAKVDKGITRY